MVLGVKCGYLRCGGAVRLLFVMDAGVERWKGREKLAKCRWEGGLIKCRPKSAVVGITEGKCSAQRSGWHVHATTRSRVDVGACSAEPAL